MSLLSLDWILLGYITRAHGIKGALAYQVLHAESDCLRDGLEIALLKTSPLTPLQQLERGINPSPLGGEGGTRSVTGEVSRGAKNFRIKQILSGERLLFEGITDRTEAEKLAKTEIWVRRSDFKELASDEVYLADLIGFDAQDLKGEILGKVTGFSDNRAQILVEIAHKTLVPFVKPILIKIDEDNRCIILDLPEGYDL